MKQRIAIIGSGVSGLVAAHLLHRKHSVTVFEARDRVGGHVCTVDVGESHEHKQSIDIGFIVYNEHNYPLFSRLIEQLGVETQASNMSFGVRCDRSGLEYGSENLRTLFAQPSNVVNPRFYSMLRGIFRFNREATGAVRNGAAELSLGQYLAKAEFSRAVTEHYLMPMGSALWSMPRGRVLEMPAEFFVRFFENHGMLTVNDQPEWRVISGGSARYVEALVAAFQDRIRTSSPVRSVERRHAHVVVNGENFDHVVFACHADQALRILGDATPRERDVLGALPFQANEVVLHTDTSVLPRSRRAWASWNYHVGGEAEAPATVTYNMNRLQTLEAESTYCVTLNATHAIDPDSILYRARFSHPVYDRASIAAQHRHDEISGVDRTHFCGAYWGFGFHEDGVRSAVKVAERFGVGL
ncbi:MAG: FAD-dependent oxidoreductase [Gemmatimonadota bacterium]|jgi:predicted NAD/FAD-binding protein